MKNFSPILAAIERPAPGANGETRYRVRQIEGSQHFIGVDSTGHAALLIHSSQRTSRAPIRLARLDVQFSLPCRLLENDREEKQDVFTAVTCRSSEATLIKHFCHAAEMLIKVLGTQPSDHKVYECVTRLTELFQNLSRGAGGTAVGLFGELLVIHLSSDPKASVRAWRSNTDDRYDFSVDDFRLEVKTAGNRHRSHHFSREQCMPPDGTVALVASVLAEASGGGLALRELVEQIEPQLESDAELILKLHINVAETLGDSLDRALEVRFDEQLARTSLAFFDLREIPAIRDGVPVELSEVRFKVDLSTNYRVRLDEIPVSIHAGLLPN